jgi:SET domain-containing protein
MISHKLVKQKSNIHGYGLFAKEPIKKGEVVCLDTHDMHSMSQQEFVLLPQFEKERWEQHGYYDARDGLLKLETDDGVYFNHGENPNVTDMGETMIANRDVQMGEELTVDYRPYYLPGEKLPDFITTKLVCTNCKV